MKAAFRYFLVIFITCNLVDATVVAIGMWGQNVPWRNWYLFIIAAVDGIWAKYLMDRAEGEPTEKK